MSVFLLMVGSPSGSTSLAKSKLLQSCLTLCDPRDGSPWGSPVPGILLARTLEWAAISFSNAWKWKVKVKSLSRVRLFATPWTAATQAPPSMGFSRQECWSGVPPWLEPNSDETILSILYWWFQDYMPLSKLIQFYFIICKLYFNKAWYLKKKKKGPTSFACSQEGDDLGLAS